MGGRYNTARGMLKISGHFSRKTGHRARPFPVGDRDPVGRVMDLGVQSRNIRVNCLSPGGVDTPIIDLQMPTKEGADEMRKYMVAGVPLGRLGTADELAKAVLFLASDDSSYITGIDLQVD